MSPENIQFSIIGGMALVLGLVFLIPSVVKKRAKQGSSSSNTAPTTVEDAVNSFKESVDSLSSDSPVMFRKSKSSSYDSKSGGSRRRCKKGGKRKTKDRR